MQKRARVTLYRRSPNLVFYWSGDKLVVENYYECSKVRASPLLFQVLNFFSRWRSARQFARGFPQFDRHVVPGGLRLLLRWGLIERSGGRNTFSLGTTRGWANWHLAATFFHFSTKDVPYSTDLVFLLRRQRSRARSQSMPPGVKHYPQAKQVALPSPHGGGEFLRVLLARRTWRRFSQKPLGLSALSTLLGFSFGVQSWVRLSGLGRVALKTSPSGGARHPIEAYVLARRVKDLSPGLYHYAADKHSLELLKPGGNAAQIVRYLAGQKWYGNAAALVLMTAVFRRPQWKYESPRAYRAVLIDAGHLCQTFCLVATWLGLAPFCSMALADSLVEADIGIDGVSESVLYAAGVGALPSGVDWAPWPGNVSGGTRRPNRPFAGSP
jgi:SagB-type dehydrogenase family enzyme